MEFTCNKDNLIEGINIVQKAVANKSTIPALEGILIEVGEELKLTGNDTELGIVYEVPTIIEETGKVVVNSKTFGDVIRKLPDLYVTIRTLDNGLLEVNSGASVFKLKTMDPEGYPKVNPISGTSSYKLPGKELRDLIKKTIFAVSKEDMRPILKGEFMEITGSEVNFVAIDGYKMAVKSIERQENPISVVIPARILEEVSKFINDDKEEIIITLNENMIMFQNKAFMMVSRLLKGEYLKYRTMIPREFNTELTVKTKEFMSAIERATLVMTDERKVPLIMEISGNEIDISANAERGENKEVVHANIKGDDIRLGFNSRNILEALRVIEDDEIAIKFTTNQGPCVIKSVENEDDYTYMVMPVLTKR